METTKKKAKSIQAVFLSGGLLLLLILGLALVRNNIFGAERADRCIYGAGLVVAAFLWTAFVSFGAEGLFKRTRELMAAVYLKSHMRTAMSACISLLGMYYFNSGSNHGHRIGTRLMLICFAVILLTYLEKQDRKIRSGLVWTGLCTAAFAGYAMSGMVREDRHAEFVLNFIVAVLFGLTVLFWLEKCRRQKAEKEAGQISVFYTVLLLGFFVLLIAFRNTRGWPFTIAVPFTLLYRMGLSEEEWKSLLLEFLNGVLWSFGVILAFSLLFRPYHKFFSPRYPMAFFSVATCSLYLVVVFLAAFWKLLVCFGEGKRGKELFFPVLVMGTVFCYTIMTVSRTAFLAIGTAAAVAVVCLAVSCFRGKMTALFFACGMTVVSAAVLFPFIFTITRSIPAFVGHPFIMGGEFWEGETITSDDPIDSEKYMDIRRFRSLTIDKLSGSFGKDREAREEKQKIWEYMARPQGLTATVAPAFLVAHGVTPDTWYNESEGSASNGRVAIFLAYLERMNLTGHEAMGVDTEEMSYAHAHNTFIQTAYDHGIVVGICFLLLGAVSMIRAVFYSIRRKNDWYAVIPVMMITAFGVAGMTEWIFHPSILLGFTLLLVQGPLLFRLPEKKGHPDSL